MARLEDLIDRFDVDDPAFIADPYPVLNALREAAPVFWNHRTEQWVLTRFHDVSATLRDRRLGRSAATARGVNTFEINRRMRV